MLFSGKTDFSIEVATGLPDFWAPGFFVIAIRLVARSARSGTSRRSQRSLPLPKRIRRHQTAAGRHETGGVPAGSRPCKVATRRISRKCHPSMLEASQLDARPSVAQFLHDQAARPAIGKPVPITYATASKMASPSMLTSARPCFGKFSPCCPSYRRCLILKLAGSRPPCSIFKPFVSSGHFAMKFADLALHQNFADLVFDVGLSRRRLSLFRKLWWQFL